MRLLTLSSNCSLTLQLMGKFSLLLVVWRNLNMIWSLCVQVWKRFVSKLIIFVGHFIYFVVQVSTDVRQWRMAMDVDLTDKEDRLTQLSLRLDDIERNQQALIIRYPQLMQPAAPASSTSSSTPAHSPTPPERLSSRYELF